MNFLKNWRFSDWILLSLAVIGAYLGLALLTYSPIDNAWSVANSDLTIQNKAGLIGAFVADLLNTFFSPFAFVIPLALIICPALAIYYRKICSFKIFLNISLNLFIAIISLSVLSNLIFDFQTTYISYGIAGAVIIDSFIPLIGKYGLFLLALIGLVISSLVLYVKFIKPLNIAFTKQNIQTSPEEKQETKVQIIRPEPIITEPTVAKPNKVNIENITELHNSPPFVEPAPKASEPQITEPKLEEDDLIHPMLRKAKFANPTGEMPSIDLFDNRPDVAEFISDNEILNTSKRIEQELANFKIQAKVADVLVGPVVTRYEIEPAPGTDSSRISKLATNLARNLMFKSIRISEFIPNKPYIGIEAPNPVRQTVWFKNIIADPKFQNCNFDLPLAIGQDIAQNTILIDLAKSPHLLVAGQTGAGKSVGINTMILSLLFKCSPKKVKFIMIDPKVVELSVYEDIPHLLTPVVTDMKKASYALSWAVSEMENRYKLLSLLGVRSINAYNEKIIQANEMNKPIPNLLIKPTDGNLPPTLEELPFIVIVVDEFADLILQVGKQVEELIARITAKARAVGIHLILATQRPSTDVITGTIKNNIPSRIAFTVPTGIDSRTILDRTGAESLLGRGDMLYMNGPEIIRVHGAFVEDHEVVKIANDWKAREKPNYLSNILKDPNQSIEIKQGVRAGELDDLFEEIKNFVIETNTTTINTIQRKFGLGFPRASRIVDQLTEQGVLSAPDHKGKREVLANKEL